MEFRLITTDDPLYAAERQLRLEALGRPMGLKASDLIFPYEDESLHLVALEGARLVGCVLFHPEGERGRLYQMAVAEDLRGRGIGRDLVARLERMLRERGIGEIYLHARDLAVSFYEGIGFEIYDEPFIEVGIEHRHMRKGI